MYLNGANTSPRKREQAQNTRTHKEEAKRRKELNRRVRRLLLYSLSNVARV